jgi:hypothetical protein
MEYAAAGALAEGMHKQQRDWIDRAVGGRGEVGVLWSGNASRFSVWQNEFFNRSVGRQFHVRYPMEGGLPATELRLDRATGRLGADVGVPYVLTDASVELVGDVVATDPGRNVVLYAVDPPLRQAALVEGLHPADTWSGPTVTYTRFDCEGGTVSAEVQGDRAFNREPSTVRAAGRAFTIPADGKPHVITVPLVSRDGRCATRFFVSPVLVPGPQDPRPLGLHFNSFAYRP